MNNYKGDFVARYRQHCRPASPSEKTMFIDKLEKGIFVPTAKEFTFEERSYIIRCHLFEHGVLYVVARCKSERAPDLYLVRYPHGERDADWL